MDAASERHAASTSTMPPQASAVFAAAGESLTAAAQALPTPSSDRAAKTAIGITGGRPARCRLSARTPTSKTAAPSPTVSRRAPRLITKLWAARRAVSTTAPPPSFAAAALRPTPFSPISAPGPRFSDRMSDSASSTDAARSRTSFRRATHVAVPARARTSMAHRVGCSSATLSSSSIIAASADECWFRQSCQKPAPSSCACVRSETTSSSSSSPAEFVWASSSASAGASAPHSPRTSSKSACSK